MSKMIRPEMSVVRFKEADVIVASGGSSAPQSMSASGWANGVEGDFTLNYGGKDYGYNDRYTLISLLNQNGQSDHTSTYGTKPTIEGLYNIDHNDDKYTTPINGFDWNSQTGRWVAHQ